MLKVLVRNNTDLRAKIHMEKEAEWGRQILNGHTSQRKGIF